MIEKDGVRVGVIEHLMAAIAGAGLDDVTVTLDGPEPPILDGDALSYLASDRTGGLARAGREAPRHRAARGRVEVTEGDASAALEPADETSYDFILDFLARRSGGRISTSPSRPKAFAM